jgi:hypothetical protein
MFRRLPLALLCLSIAPASAADTSSPPLNSPQWQIYAGCAAAYQANWQHRLADPNRTHDMSNMIHEQSDEYKKVAISYYVREQKTSQDDANKHVTTYVESNVGGFLAMDTPGRLQPYLEQYPHPQEQHPHAHRRAVARHVCKQMARPLMPSI